MKKIFNILRIISIAIVLLLAALVFVPSLLGVTPTVDLLDTMQPKISKGSISYINKNYSYENLKKNDIIQIKKYNQKMMVRIQSKNSKDKSLNVKGDAESTQDIFVITNKEYTGKHIFTIPKVGIIVLFFQRNFFVTIILITIIVISLIMDYFDYRNTHNDKTVKTEKNKSVEKDSSSKTIVKKEIEILQSYENTDNIIKDNEINNLYEVEKEEKNIIKQRTGSILDKINKFSNKNVTTTNNIKEINIKTPEPNQHKNNSYKKISLKE